MSRATDVQVNHSPGGIFSRIAASILRALMPCGALLARSAGLSNRVPGNRAFRAFALVHSIVRPLCLLAFRSAFRRDGLGDLVFHLDARLANRSDDQRAVFDMLENTLGFRTVTSRDFVQLLRHDQSVASH